MKKVWNILLTFMVFAALIGMMGFASNQRRHTLCKEIQVMIDKDQELRFLTEEDIRLMILDMGEFILDVPAADIPIDRLETRLGNNPYIRKADLFMTLDGSLQVKIIQREPIARIIAGPTRSYYLDKDGYFMPPSSQYTAHVPVINGHFRLPFHTGLSIDNGGVATGDSVLIKDLYHLAGFLHKDPFWKVQIMQIYVNEEKDLELTPRVGDHRILLGDMTDMEEKFRKLKIFYREGLNYTDWNRYSTINLKYKNQIICTKR